MGTTEEVAGGVVRAVQGAEVKARVVGATRSMEGEARVVVAMRRAGEVVRVIKQAVRWPGGAVGLSTSATRVVRPLGGAI
jgi:hypothetical protein